MVFLLFFIPPHRRALQRAATEDGTEKHKNGFGFLPPAAPGPSAFLPRFSAGKYYRKTSLTSLTIV